MQRKSAAALCLLAVAILLACSRNGPPNSLLESAGYHVRDGKVYYLNAWWTAAFPALALTAALFHILNHSMFKSLLFFGAGAVLTATLGVDPATVERNFQTWFKTVPPR
jgi:NADH:ubiquinone oxidoreductase subunit 5 (subunit L)/multisubunit Na+/H+ antiporter MnhA subunit